MRKQEDDLVFGGTSNDAGTIIVRATPVGEQSVLSQVQRLIEEAQTVRAPIEALADFVSAIFVPTVLAISAGVLVVWYVLASRDAIPAQWYAG